MSSVLYYSQYCNNCQNLLTLLSKSEVKNDMHFICIDKRHKENGQTVITLQTGQKLMLPPSVTKVPALLLLNKNNHVLFGSQITDYLQPEFRSNTKQAVQHINEPMAFTLGGGMTGVSSDAYSFLDQTSDDLNASEGSGGVRQMHNYVMHDANPNIDTPPDTWQPDKISGDMNMEDLQQKRQAELPQMKRADI